MSRQPTGLAGASRVESFLRRSHGLGIGARLFLGFGLIGALFLTANVVTQRNAAKSVVQIDASNQASRDLEEIGRALADSLAAYQRTVRERIAVEKLGLGQRTFNDAQQELDVRVQEYANLKSPIDAALSAQQLSKSIRSLQVDAQALLTSAKRRDDLLTRYWDGLDRLQQRLAEPQQNVWGIGDRAFTRRSATSMTDALSAIRTAVGGYLASPSAQRALEIDLEEENFLIALAKNSPALISSQGETWLRNLRKDFEKLQRFQRDARASRDATQTDFAKFSMAADELSRNIRVGINEPASRALLESVNLAGDIARRTERNVAILSIGCLSLLLLIAWLTSRSVISPVDRLIQATHRLGSGDEVARVTRGGVRELDQLAGAFNAMAEQLTEAQRGVREQQAKLEERVVERTQQLQHLAYHDSLTQLPNRRHLFKQLGVIIEQASEERRAVMLLVLDLDNFKTLNDSLGHHFGDRVLKAVSQRLLEVAEDGGFAARLGGDEFTIVRELRFPRDDVAAHADRLLGAFQRPLHVGDNEVIVGLSVGAAVFPDHASDAESLLRAADGALFKAKAFGRNQTCIATPELIQHISAQFNTEQALRRAIQYDELEVLYQPQVSLSGGEVTCVEALLRWRRDGAYVMPLDFLPLAEQSGLISEITDWVLKRAVQSLAIWHHGAWPEARVAVNISAQQFIDHLFVSRLQNLLKLHNVPPSSLELELTENVLQSGPTTARTLRELRELGVGIALDDFGAGYSSLASLDKLQISRVKIDRSLIENVDRNARSASIARSMIALCRSLNLYVTAEGVERAEQLRFLSQCEDVDVQGFLLAHPMPAERVAAAGVELRTAMRELTDPIREKNRNTQGSVSQFPRRGVPRQT